VHLAYTLLEGYDTLILVDALARGEPPGTLYVLEPDLGAPTPGVLLDGHGLDPASVLAMVERLGGAVGRTVVVGCEPAAVDPGLGLSPPVARAVDEAVKLVMRLVGEHQKEARA
jgi:hydrogenase maturation protease